jgi:acetylglutamate kinase
MREKCEGKIVKQIVVIKLGGSVLEQLHPTFYPMCQQLLQQGIAPLIVHGGGAEISRWMQRIGKKPQFIAGRRVTDQENLAIASAVLGGQINKRLVAALGESGAPTIGLSGIDLGLLTVRPLDAALGYVGEVTRVAAQPLHALLAQGWIPVLASLGVDSTGQHYNVNADEVAAAVAQAVGATRLLLVSDVDGVQDAAGELLPRLDATMIAQYIASGVIKNGMLPKVRAGLASLQCAVQEVIICNGAKPWGNPLTKRYGTHLVKEGTVHHVAIS